MKRTCSERQRVALKRGTAIRNLRGIVSQLRQLTYSNPNPILSEVIASLISYHNIEFGKAKCPKCKCEKDDNSIVNSLCDSCLNKLLEL